MNRRLATGIVISLLLHGFVLSLQFGMPSLALPGRAPAISISLAPPVPVPPQPLPAELTPDPLPPAATPETVAAAVTGLTLVDPVPTPALPPPPRREAIARKDKPRRQRRISTPLPKPGLDAATRVIAQADKADSEFVVPLPEPEEAVQQTIDPAEAQHGTDEPPEAAPAAEPEPEILARAEQQRKELEQQAVLAAQLRADEERIAAAARAREQADQRRRDEALAQERQARELLERQQADARLAQQQQQRVLELAERHKEEELLAQQRRMQELAERQNAGELVAQRRRMQELADRQKAEELLAQQRRAQEAAERQRLEEMAARRLAEEAARQQAARERDLAQGGSAPATDPFGRADGQGGNGRTKAPAAAYGSDLSNRVREMSKGLDLLSGAPPARPRTADDSSRRRVVADSSQRDVPLRMYVESWRQKIERNGAMNFPKMIGDVRIDPLVSVAVRSDGSIEDVTIVRSSGRADTDDAVRRIVRINARYSSFPPHIAARYDVIEIRRIWTFDQVLKLIEEIR